MTLTFVCARPSYDARSVIYSANNTLTRLTVVNGQATVAIAFVTLVAVAIILGRACHSASGISSAAMSRMRCVLDVRFEGTVLVIAATGVSAQRNHGTDRLTILEAVHIAHALLAPGIAVAVRLACKTIAFIPCSAMLFGVFQSLPHALSVCSRVTGCVVVDVRVLVSGAKVSFNCTLPLERNHSESTVVDCLTLIIPVAGETVLTSARMLTGTSVSASGVLHAVIVIFR